MKIIINYLSKHQQSEPCASFFETVCRITRTKQAFIIIATTVL